MTPSPAKNTSARLMLAWHALEAGQASATSARIRRRRGSGRSINGGRRSSSTSGGCLSSDGAWTRWRRTRDYTNDEAYARDKFYAWWWRWKHCSWWPGKRWSKGCQVRVSNSRNHVASWLTLFGPRASHAASQDGDWDDMDEILKHLPVTGGQRALQMQKVALFDPVILKEYLKIHLSSLYPGEPDMCWDYPAWWTRSGRHGFTVFSGILIRGMYLGNWGTFVEHGSSTST